MSEKFVGYVCRACGIKFWAIPEEGKEYNLCPKCAVNPGSTRWTMCSLCGRFISYDEGTEPPAMCSSCQAKKAPGEDECEGCDGCAEQCGPDECDGCPARPDQPKRPYDALMHVFAAAISQAASGKGRERHAVEGENFEDQQICEITRRVGLGFALGQAVKKIYESQRLPAIRARTDELLGAMVYLASAVIVIVQGEEERLAAVAAQQAKDSEANARRRSEELEQQKYMDDILGAAKGEE